MPRMLLAADGIGKTYVGEKGAQVEAIGSVSFSVREGEFVAIVGPSGCGKTTLLRTIAGLLKPSRGEVNFEGRTYRRVPDGFGIVFQEYNRSLFPWLSVRKNVEFGLQALPKPGAHRAGHRGAPAGAPHRRRGPVSVAAVRRHAATGGDRPGAGNASPGAADGRAVRVA